MRINKTERWTLQFWFPGVAGAPGDDDFEKDFERPELAIAEARKAKKDPENYNITVTHKWFDAERNCMRDERVEWDAEEQQ